MAADFLVQAVCEEGVELDSEESSFGKEGAVLLYQRSEVRKPSGRSTVSPDRLPG